MCNIRKVVKKIAKKYKNFPKTCNACTFESPTELCEKLFTTNALKKGFFPETTYTKRRKDCPLTQEELNNIGSK